MANYLPSSSSVNAAFGSTSTVPGEGETDRREIQLAERIVNDIINPHFRDHAISELAKKREQFKDLAVLLWHSVGIMDLFLQEIMALYPALSPPTLTSSQSNRICNVVSLLQCVALHEGTRNLFIDANIPSYLYPFLNAKSNSRPFENLRLISFCVIIAMVKVHDSRVINFLIQSEIMPYCLGTMDLGTELSKNLATFIVQKIMVNNYGLNYICATSHRFLELAGHLENMVTVEQPSPRLLKNLLRCYLRLSEHRIAREVLMGCLPNVLRESTPFASSFRDDPEAIGMLRQLLRNIRE